MNTDSLLSILMLTCNDAKYLEGCLGSIKENVSSPFEVILVDNGSSERVNKDIEAKYPWLRVIRSERNLGFNAGNNLAAKNARGDYLLLLNIDTLLLSDVAPAIRLLESDARVGAVGAEAYDSNRRRRPSAGHFPKPYRLWLFKSLWMKPKDPYGPPQAKAFRVDWVEGSFLMTRRSNWEEIGGFEERYFLFGNDLHYCRSLVERGLVVVQSGAVRYVHFCGFGVGRLGNLYAGFREYHKKYSSKAEQKRADLVLRLGLLARIGFYGIRYGLTGNTAMGEKFRKFTEVRRNWGHLRP